MPKIAKFTGLDNVNRPELAGPGALQTARNVLITDEGAIAVRPGRTEVLSGRTHSLFGGGSKLIYAHDGALLRGFGDALETLIGTLQDDLTPIDYLELNGKVYFSNGTDSGIIQVDGSVTPWGVAVPSAPTCTPGTGSGDPGTYLVATAFLLSDGQESGASTPQPVEVVSGGIDISGLDVSSDTRVLGINVYVSGPNGEAGPTGEGLFKAAFVAAGTTTCTIKDLPATGEECVTLNMTPMPATRFLCIHGGRIYGASGTTVFMSEPWNYELLRLERGFLPFQAAVTSLTAVEGGIAVGTGKRVVFAAGKDPEADGGMVLKSEVMEPCVTGGVVVAQETIKSRLLGPSPRGLFVTGSGVYAIDGGGTMTRLTKGWGFTDVRPTQRGCVYDVDGQSWYTFSAADHVYAMNLDNFAVTQFIHEGAGSLTVHKGTLYVGDSSGLYTVDGDHDRGVPLVAIVQKQGIDFNSNMIKRLSSIFMQLRSTGNLTIIVASENRTGTVVLYDGINQAHGSRVKTPKGVRGRNLSLTIMNNDGAWFEVSEMDLITEVLSVHARQTRS